MSRDLAVVIDLDGTFVDNKHLLETYLPMPSHVKDENQYWTDFIEESLYCKANWWCSRLIKDMLKANVEIIFLTSRTGSIKNRDLTKRWLDAVLPEDAEYTLVMRNRGCHKPDHVSKKDLMVTNIVPYYDVIFAVDDKKENIDMFESLSIKGLLC